jgi:hypothetical protein
MKGHTEFEAAVEQPHPVYPGWREHGVHPEIEENELRCYAVEVQPGYLVVQRVSEETGVTWGSGDEYYGVLVAYSSADGGRMALRQYQTSVTGEEDLPHWNIPEGFTASIGVDAGEPSRELAERYEELVNEFYPNHVNGGSGEVPDSQPDAADEWAAGEAPEG